MSLCPHFINSIIISDPLTVHLIVNFKKIIPLIFLLRNHSLLRFSNIVDIFCVDYPSALKRFEIIYTLRSLSYNCLLHLHIRILEQDYIESVSTLFKGAVWFEREVWDMFGVFFKNNPDLRRILSDYGFEGFPLRKDFPLTGYLEVRYDDEVGDVVYEPVELSQDYRYFNFSSPWERLTSFSSNF